MIRMKYLTLVAVFVGSLSFPADPPTMAAESSTTGNRPNILYFYMDDMGWGSIGPNGQAARKAKNLPRVQTPNIDRLAAQGINFTRGYGCHVCSPARSSQQSGFHQGHTFADRNDPNNAKKAMRSDDVLMGDALSAAGYVTGYWGKWGYGGSKDQNNPVVQNVQTLPTSHGYQHVLAELHHVRAHTFFQPTLWSAPSRKRAIGGLELKPNSLADYRGKQEYPNTPALQNDADYPRTAYCDDAYAFAALDFVRSQGNHYNETGQPFFGLLACQIPHAPFGEIASLPQWDAAYAKDPHFASLANQTRQWAAMVTRIDAHIGNILAALEDPNNDGDTSDSVVDDTLVIFQSDNGGPGGKNNVDLDANGGLRGTKGKIQEGGIRVPLVMRWPAKINSKSELKPGTNCEMIVDVTDLLPTFCEVAGMPSPLGIDGVSIAPTLTGGGHQRHREFIIHEAGNGQSIIRGQYKLVRGRNAPLELYDLVADHAEENDIAADHPELIVELETLLLGERVAESRGFANTYHHWTGDDNAATSDPDNWSDYSYTNAGITYMEDGGSPQPSWVARITNDSDQPKTAYADADADFLGLEVRGNAEAAARQSLIIGPDVRLTGRNEIRLAAHSRLTIENGSVSSLRWIDIQPLAILDGIGKIDCTVYNNGTVAVVIGANLDIQGDYHQAAKGTLEIGFTGQPKIAVRVSGTAHLAGSLTVTVAKGQRLEPGESYTLLTADRVSGTFATAPGHVILVDGEQFTLRYGKSAVTLVPKSGTN